MLRLQATKSSNSEVLHSDELTDDQSLRATTKRIVIDAKVKIRSSFSLFNYVCQMVFAHLAYTPFSE